MKAWLCRWLKVPPEPTLPPGSRESAQVFRAALNYYRLLLLRWAGAQVSAVIGIMVSLAFLRGISQGWSEQLRFWVEAAEYAGIAFYVIQVPFTFLMVRLDYELRWYIVTDRSLRIRSGLFHVREMTMTFANIQHLAVHQGPLQRLLGLYDLKVRTAGGGGAEPDPHQQGSNSSATHIGHFHGVDNAPVIRDLILERMKRAHDAGLGDTDDVADSGLAHAAGEGDGMDEFRSAMAAVRTETEALHRTLTHERR
jgi:membrane protein YdbS with pleckstrin-like domain